jgi:hypothetical protein
MESLLGEMLAVELELVTVVVVEGVLVNFLGWPMDLTQLAS